MAFLVDAVVKLPVAAGVAPPADGTALVRVAVAEVEVMRLYPVSAPAKPFSFLPEPLDLRIRALEK